MPQPPGREGVKGESEQPGLKPCHCYYYHTAELLLSDLCILRIKTFHCFREDWKTIVFSKYILSFICYRNILHGAEIGRSAKWVPWREDKGILNWCRLHYAFHSEGVPRKCPEMEKNSTVQPKCKTSGINVRVEHVISWSWLRLRGEPWRNTWHRMMSLFTFTVSLTMVVITWRWSFCLLEVPDDGRITGQTKKLKCWCSRMNELLGFVSWAK